MSIEISINLSNSKKTVRKKGKSLTMIPEEFIVIDIETTGLDPRWSEIIEIGALKVKDGQIIDTYNTLVQPGEIEDEDNTYYVDDFITELTGITNKMLKNAPTIEDVLPRFSKFIGDDILIGHNINFDINFLYDNFKEFLDVTLDNNYVDLLRLVRKLYPHFKNHKLVTVADNLKVDHSNNHRSLADCEITLNCFNQVTRHIRDNGIDLTELFRKKYGNSLDLTKIQATTDQIDKDHMLYDRNCTFTGKLEKMERKQAAQLVVDVGGHCLNNLTKKTNYLILGNFDYNASIKEGQKSSKLKKAEKYILGGQDLKILSEDVFYDLFEEEY